MKIYTRTGDDGTTGLIGGSRVAKNDARLDAYGTVDELNALLGVASVTADPTMRVLLTPIQETLFVLGSHLAAPADDATARKYLPALDPQMVAVLEAQIDTAEGELPKLTHFVLPGGTETAARLHVARTVCRRAERLIVAFGGRDSAEVQIEAYFNRLSDWLFVYARLANHRAGVHDVLWIPKR